MVGNGPSPVAGRVTSTSSGTPSKLATRDARSGVGQNRTPSCGVQAWPNGAGAAWAAGTAARDAAAAQSAATRRGRGRMTRHPTGCGGAPARAPPGGAPAVLVHEHVGQQEADHGADRDANARRPVEPP